MTRMFSSRRQFFLGIGLGAVGAFAGCTGDDTTDDSDDAEATEDAITLARLELAIATEMLAREDDLDTEDPREVREVVEDAEDTLDAVADDANEEQAAQISFLRDVADWLRQTTAAIEAFDRWDEEFERSRTYFAADRYDDASRAAENASEELEAAKSTHSEAIEAYDSLDEGRLDDLDDIDHRSLADWLEGPFQEGFVAAEGLTNGFAALIPGFEQFFTALEPLDHEDKAEIDDEDWQAAETRFSAARDRFLEAEAIFRAAEEDSPPALLEDLVALTALATDLAGASDHYGNAMAAAQDGDWDRFEQEVDAAEESMS